MLLRGVLTMMAGVAALAGAASAATRVEPLSIRITDGDGAGSLLSGRIIFDDANLPDDLSGGFSVNPEDDALRIEFPLINDIVATEVDEFVFPEFPIATFDGDGALVDLEFEVLEADLFLEVLGNLTFFFEIGEFDNVTAAGSGVLLGGTAAIPVPGAALLFAPTAAFALRRRFARR